MGALIAYHYFNRAEYRNDVRFADNFLLIAPGITIRDRLGVNPVLRLPVVAVLLLAAVHAKLGKRAHQVNGVSLAEQVHPHRHVAVGHVASSRQAHDVRAGLGEICATEHHGSRFADEVGSAADHGAGDRVQTGHRVPAQRLADQVLSVTCRRRAIEHAQPLRQRPRRLDMFADAHLLEDIVDHPGAQLDALGLRARGGTLGAASGFDAELTTPQVEAAADEREE
jgi:hypothetical protein